MYIINKIIDDELETLPDIVDTPIWEDYEKGGKMVKLLANLYIAISRRENYYQLNTPTAYGDPDYARYSGIVFGILQAGEMDETEDDGYIVIKKNKRRLLIIEKVNRPASYYECKKEINELMKEIGL